MLLMIAQPNNLQHFLKENDLRDALKHVTKTVRNMAIKMSKMSKF